MKHFEFINGQITSDILKEFEYNSPVDCGAATTFHGSIRADEYESKKVIAIEFAAHEEIAMKIAIEILDDAIERFKLKQAIILHSLSKVGIGQTCFYVIVKSAHRKESFEALPWVVNEFKEKVPVFGKEIMEDGTYVWKTNKK